LTKQEVKRKRDYYIVDQKVWEFLHGIYGGGPILHKEKKDVNFDTVSMRSSTSFEGTSIGNNITDTVSISDFGMATRDGTNSKRLTAKDNTIFNTSKKSSLFSQRSELSNDQLSEKLKNQSSFNPNKSYIEQAIQEEPHEEEMEKPRNFIESGSKSNNASYCDNTEDEYFDEGEESDSELEGEESEESVDNCEFNIIGLANPNNF
jgi:hypothetical protein